MNIEETAVDFLAKEYDLTFTEEYRVAKEIEKQQSKNLYSELEVITLINQLNCGFKNNPKQNITEWFNQYKKSIKI